MKNMKQNGKIILSLFAGLWIGVITGAALMVTDEPMAEPEVVTVVENMSDEQLAHWKELDKVYQEYIRVSIENNDLCSSTITAFTEFDINTIESNSKKMDDQAKKINNLANKRQEIVSKIENYQ